MAGKDNDSVDFGEYSSLPSLGTALFCFVAIFATTAFVAFIIFLDDRLDDYKVRVQTSETAYRGAALNFVLTQALAREWSGHTSVARSIDFSDREQTALRARAIAKNQKSVEWVAIADASGRLFASSDDAKVSMDVSGEDWFRERLSAAQITEVYQYNVLAQFFPEKNGSHIRYLDFSSPIYDKNRDSPVGVLVWRLRVSWLREFLQDAAELLSSEVFLLNAENDVILSYNNLSGTALSGTNWGMILTGTTGTTTTAIPGLGRAVLSVQPRITGDDLPRLGWRLVARTHVQDWSFTDLNLNTELLVALGMLLLALLIGTIVFMRQFIQPLRLLSLQAKAIALGQNIHPEETKSSREAARLSAAFARIQASSRVAGSRIISYQI